MGRSGPLLTEAQWKKIAHLLPKPHKNRHPFVERLIGTIRLEYFDHLLFWTTADLEGKLLDFRTYFNNYRTHTSREGRTPDTPVSRTIANLHSFRWQTHCRSLYQTPMAP